MGPTVEDNVLGYHGWCGREFDGFRNNEIDGTDSGRQALSTGQGDREAAAVSERRASRGKLRCGFSASGVIWSSGRGSAMCQRGTERPGEQSRGTGDG